MDSKKLNLSVILYMESKGWIELSKKYTKYISNMLTQELFIYGMTSYYVGYRDVSSIE
jgi:hypothetical protein